MEAAGSLPQVQWNRQGVGTKHVYGGWLKTYSQISFTFYFVKRPWTARVFRYVFTFNGMWELCLRFLWFGIDVHNNCVWLAEDEAIQLKRQKRLDAK